MRILIVDNSKAMRMIVARTLRQGGYGKAAMEEAADGVEALKLLEVDPFDLVLCDWNMPRMNGFELLQEMTRRGLRSPFGLIAADLSQERKDAALAAGALFVLTKPFTVRELEKALGPILEPPKSLPGQAPA
jgi:two-component system chemotaxis response regulator CheY